MRRSAAVALLAFLMVGCDDGDTLAPGTGPGLISGTVARQKTAEGVPGAVLVLVDDAGRVSSTTVSDADGRFGFPDVGQGDYSVRLVAPELAGLDPLFDALEPEAWDVSVAADPVELVFAVVGLVPARITGTVSCGGVPAVGVEVRVIGGDTDAGAATDGAGIFTVLDLLPGTYAVIPVDPPCDLSTPFVAAPVRPGQFVDLTFGG